MVELANGKMWMVCRGLGGHLWQAWSDDDGATWCTPSPTTLISPLSAVNAKRIPGSDAVIVFWNHARPGTSKNWNDVNNFWRPRSPLVFAISKDNCRSWSRPVTVTPGTATYPAICFLRDKMYVEFWEDPDPKALYGNPKSHLILLAYDVAALLRFAGQPIAYIQKDVPTIDLPAYQGDRYEAVVPDTLDLAERAALAVNGLTGPLDPMADYELYWRACFHHNPPIMGHDFNDHVQAKFHESLPLMRLISGSHQNEEVDTRWMQVVMQMQGPDGLLYYPLKGRPWAKTEVYLEQTGGRVPAATTTPSLSINGRLLGAITLYYKTTGDERWKELGKRIVDGLTQAGRPPRRLRLLLSDLVRRERGLRSESAVARIVDRRELRLGRHRADAVLQRDGLRAGAGTGRQAGTVHQMPRRHVRGRRPLCGPSCGPKHALPRTSAPAVGHVGIRHGRTRSGNDSVRAKRF